MMQSLWRWRFASEGNRTLIYGVQTVRRRRVRWWAILSLAALLFGASELDAQEDRVPREERYAYFWGFQGDFIKVDLWQRAVVAAWRLPWVASLDEVLPQHHPSASTGWQFLSPSMIPGTGVVIGIAPSELGFNEIVEYQLLKLGLPGMALTARADLGGGFLGSPGVVVTGDHVLVSAQRLTTSEGDSEILLRAFRLGTLKPTWQVTEADTLHSFGPDARSMGDLIYSGGRLFSVGPRGIDRVPLADLWEPSASFWEWLEEFTGISRSVRTPILESFVVDGAAGKLLFRFQRRDATDWVLFTLDIESGELSSRVEVSGGEIWRARLAPSGELALLEQLELRELATDGGERVEAAVRTGVVALASFGGEGSVRQIELPEIEGSPLEPWCLTRSGEAFFASGDEGLYQVSTEGSGRAVLVTRADPGAGSRCFLTDR